LKHIVVFASGSGTNFQAIIDAVVSGKIDAKIAGLVTNKHHIQAIERARNHDIPVRVLSPNEFESEASYAGELLKQLDAWETDLIALAGYIARIPDEIIDAYRGRIINIHPSLLPKYGGKGYYGMRVHRAVIENGEKESGCTVHYVTEEYDAGPVIEQIKVPVYPGDDAETLAERVLEQEHKLYPHVIGQIIEQMNSNQD